MLSRDLVKRNKIQKEKVGKFFLGTGWGEEGVRLGLGRGWLGLG